MKKFCVFCGNPPTEKTNEHVIPQWLIKLTGNPNRKVNFGINWYKKGLPKIDFSYSSFKFPACKICNEMFSYFERYISQLVLKMLNKENIDQVEMLIFMDWLDKIRVGLWFAYMYLTNNPKGISPQFYIKNRIAQFDRTLVIYRSDIKESRLSFIGPPLPIFQNIPSCFTLNINEFYFFNISFFQLSSRRLGFPYISDLHYKEDSHTIYGTPQKGLNRALKPVIKKEMFKGGVILHQPIFRADWLFSEVLPFYQTAYVRDHSVDFDNGQGKLFIEKASGVELYEKSPPTSWYPASSIPLLEVEKRVTLQTIDFQLLPDSLMPATRLLSQDRKRSIKSERQYNCVASEAAKKNVTLFFNNLENYFIE